MAQRHRHRRHRVLPAAVLRRDRDALRLPRRRRDAWCCTATSSAALAALLAGHERALPLLQRRPGAAAAAARGAVPERRAVLHARQARTRSWRCAARRPRTRRTPSSTRCPTFAVDARRRRAAGQRCKDHVRSDAAPRAACSPRATAGARACSTSCATSGLQPAGRRLARRVRGRADEKLGIATAALAGRLRLARAGHRLRHRDRALRDGAGARAGARKQEQASDVDALIKDLSELKRRRPGGPRRRTASAATSA